MKTYALIALLGLQAVNAVQLGADQPILVEESAGAGTGDGAKTLADAVANGEEGGSGGVPEGCDECWDGCNGPTLNCECPHLQDAGIVEGDGFGKLNFHSAEATVLGTSREEIYPDIVIDGATATNTCGLEVSANKLCGHITKTKTFTIGGDITVTETDEIDGCEGNRMCQDGRYTATKQHLTEL